MRLLRFVRRNPIAVLAVFALAFVVWVWRDSLPEQQPQPWGSNELRSVHIDAPDPEWVAPTRRLPLPPGVEEQGSVPGAQALSKLKPGMNRTEVEKLVGAPAANDIHPVTVADGKMTYHTTYEADLGPAHTVRPIQVPPRPLRDPQGLPPAVRARVSLEFDASKPGHPLLGVYYPDPLF